MSHLPSQLFAETRCGSYTSSLVFNEIVEKDVMQHNAAALLATEAMGALIEDRGTSRPISILDLACGVSTTPIRIIQNFPNHLFSYCGIENDPKQIALVQKVQHPPNIVSNTIIEGNAWLLEDTAIPCHPFDFVFSGLNFHHGTPEEIEHVLLSLRAFLQPQARLVIHDFFRPYLHCYLRRPEKSPLDGTSLTLVPKEKLRSSTTIASRDWHKDEPDWRITHLVELAKKLKACGITADSINYLLREIYEKDFPLSFDEMCDVLRNCGYEPVLPLQRSELTLYHTLTAKWRGNN